MKTWCGIAVIRRTAASSSAKSLDWLQLELLAPGTTWLLLNAAHIAYLS
jgi:hypothetical protein